MSTMCSVPYGQLLYDTKMTVNEIGIVNDGYGWLYDLKMCNYILMLSTKYMNVAFYIIMIAFNITFCQWTIQAVSNPFNNRESTTFKRAIQLSLVMLILWIITS